MKNKDYNKEIKAPNKLDIINEEIIDNFDFKLNPNYIHKNIFLTKFPNSIKNIIKIKQDNQNTFWNYSIDRLSTILRIMKNERAFRCEKILDKELKIKEIYKSLKKYDDLYQYKKYINLGKTSICHFQIRKNLLQNKNYLIYNKKYNIEIYDIINDKRQSLMSLDESILDKMICFDCYKNNDKFLICFGKDDGYCDIFSIKTKDFNECFKLKNCNKIPKFNKDLNLLVTSEKLINNPSINYDDDEERAQLFVNYVKFISENKLLTTGNDCQFKINDLNKNISEQKYENDFPINHCDLNNDKNILLCVGDSKNINIIDLKSNKIINNLKEHFDYGMVIKFNPYDNNYFASGNQDLGCKIWDIRMLNKGSILTSWGIKDSIGDLDWINSDCLCYMENSFFSHILDIKFNKIQDLTFFGFGNGVVHNKFNDDIYINIFQGNEDDTGGILCYETLKNKVINSFNNINL